MSPSFTDQKEVIAIKSSYGGVSSSRMFMSLGDFFYTLSSFTFQTLKKGIHFPLRPQFSLTWPDVLHNLTSRLSHQFYLLPLSPRNAPSFFAIRTSLFLPQKYGAPSTLSEQVSELEAESQHSCFTWAWNRNLWATPHKTRLLHFCCMESADAETASWKSFGIHLI